MKYVSQGYTLEKTYKLDEQIYMYKVTIDNLYYNTNFFLYNLDI